MKKKIVSILLCVTMVAAMAVGCGSKDGGSDSKSESGDSKDKKYKVGITIQSLSNAYWAGVMGKLEEQLKDKGWDYTLIDCEDNSATQVSQIENFITSGCDLIMVHPSDAKAVENICKEALDADIKVMCWDDPMENTTANWVLDNTELGKEIGKTAAEFINDKFTADDKAQVTVIGVVTRLLPNTGLPLPFFSYGLTSLLTLYLSMGMVLNVSLQRNVERDDEIFADDFRG